MRIPKTWESLPCYARLLVSGVRVLVLSPASERPWMSICMAAEMRCCKSRRSFVSVRTRERTFFSSRSHSRMPFYALSLLCSRMASQARPNARRTGAQAARLMTCHSARKPMRVESVRRTARGQRHTTGAISGARSRTQRAPPCLTFRLPARPPAWVYRRGWVERNATSH